MWWSSSCGRIELNITKNQAAIGSHSGKCDSDIEYLRSLPAIKRQLNKVDHIALVAHLDGYGAWDEKELADHNQNLSRLLWLACGDIVEGDI